MVKPQLNPGQYYKLVHQKRVTEIFFIWSAPSHIYRIRRMGNSSFRGSENRP